MRTANPEDEFFLVEFNERPKLISPLVQEKMLHVTRSPGPLVQHALHPVVTSVISKYSVSAAEEVFPVPKQLPVT